MKSVLRAILFLAIPLLLTVDSALAQAGDSTQFVTVRYDKANKYYLIEGQAGLAVSAVDSPKVAVQVNSYIPATGLPKDAYFDDLVKLLIISMVPLVREDTSLTFRAYTAEDFLHTGPGYEEFEIKDYGIFTDTIVEAADTGFISYVGVSRFDTERLARSTRAEVLLDGITVELAPEHLAAIGEVVALNRAPSRMRKLSASNPPLERERWTRKEGMPLTLIVIAGVVLASLYYGFRALAGRNRRSPLNG
jgi:hypothetical protein